MDSPLRNYPKFPLVPPVAFDPVAYFANLPRDEPEADLVLNQPSDMAIEPIYHRETVSDDSLLLSPPCELALPSNDSGLADGPFRGE